MNFKQAKRKVEAIGWKVDRVKGSHYIFVKNGIELVIPQHRGDIPIYLVRRIRILEEAHEEERKAAKEKVQEVLERVQDTMQEESDVQEIIRHTVPINS